MMGAFETNWQLGFERFGRTYATDHDISGWSAQGLARRLQLFERLLRQLELTAPARVLELGCGAGTYVRYLERLGHTVIGLDYSVPTLRRARAGDPDHAGRYLAGDAYALSLAQGGFDLAVCIGVPQAVSRPRALFAEIVRVLRPGGVVVIEALNPWELAAVGARFLEAVGGRERRVARYAPYHLSRWLAKHRLTPLRRIPLYLLPRRLPHIGPVFESRPVRTILDRLPGACHLVAHAFWLVGRRER